LSTLIGVYLTLIGFAVVFIMLLAVSLTGVALKRLSQKVELQRVSESLGKGNNIKTTQVAAVAAVICYLERDTKLLPRMLSLGESRWWSTARIESLERGFK
jgi:hypothetical protein